MEPATCHNGNASFILKLYKIPAKNHLVSLAALRQWILNERSLIMKFCPECGTGIEGMKFCPECGFKVPGDESGPSTQVSASTPAAPTENSTGAEEVIMEFSTFLFGLEDKNASVAGGRFDISIPQYRYTLTTERLIAENKGVVSSKREEFELYKLRDVSVKQSLVDKAQKIGTVILVSTDPGTPELIMERIRNPESVKEAIRKAAQTRKAAMHIHFHE